MINIVELQKENENIINLNTVLSILIDNASDLRTNPIFCELLDRYSGDINAHLLHEDRAVYGDLLKHSDKKVNELASQFMSNTRELKRLLSNFAKRWCGASMGDDSQEKFVAETREIFRLVEKRIDLENNKLFPVISSI